MFGELVRSISGAWDEDGLCWSFLHLENGEGSFH